MLLFIIIVTLIFIFYFFTYSLMLIAYLISTTTRAFYTFKISPHPALLIIVNVASIISISRVSFSTIQDQYAPQKFQSTLSYVVLTILIPDAS
jgi:hypothetical protein